MPPATRQKAWQEKRVVFLTPQVMTNDLSRGSCVAESIKCLVIDEAHKSLGNHAYCQVKLKFCACHQHRDICVQICNLISNKSYSCAVY